MNSPVAKYATISATTVLLVSAMALPRPAVAAIIWDSLASITGNTAYLESFTGNTSPNDYLTVRSIGVRRNRFTGPGYSVLGPWFDQPVVRNELLFVRTLDNSSTAGTHCAQGQHRWVSGNITFLRSSAQACVTLSGGGGGTCSIPNPETSILSLSGERTTLPTATLNPLTRRGVAEDARPIVVDEYALVDVRSERISFTRASDGFQATISLVGTVAAQSYSGNVPVTASKETTQEQLVNVEGHSPSGPKQLRGGYGSMLVIQHQREHLANERFAPTPRVSFTPQAVAGTPSAQATGGFAIIDFGMSGRILNVAAISESATPVGPDTLAAISGAVSTQFSDERRHDHRVYLVYEIQRGVLSLRGSPFVTMPMCCDPCPPPPYLCP